MLRTQAPAAAATLAAAMRRLAALVIASQLVACGAASSTGPGRANHDVGTSGAPHRDWTALRARLARAPLTGVVFFDRRVRLAASAAEARTQKMPGAEHGRAFAPVRVLADEGDVVRVSTELGQNRARDSVVSLRELDSAFVIEAYVDKRALLPVLARRIETSFPDGSAYVLGEGLPLVLTDAIRPWEPTMATLAVPLDEASVALSFEPGTPLPELPPPTGRELGCEPNGASTRVETASVLDEEWARKNPSMDELGVSRAGSPRRTCEASLPIEVGRSPASLPNALPILWKVREAPDDPSRVLVDVHITRASIRGTHPRAALIARVSDVSGTIGRSPRPAVKPNPGARVVFADGSPAGRYRRLRSTALPRADARTNPTSALCTARSYLTQLLCFAPGDATATNERTYDDFD